MAKTKIMLTLICLLFAGIALADTEARSVWIAPDTPYIIKIEETLNKHDYKLQSDSLKAEYYGNLLFYATNHDSIRCELELTKGDAPSFVLDSFNMEPESAKNVRSSVLKFSIWMLILNAVTAILFFARST